MAETRRLVLASGSAARRAMLQASGLTFDVIPAAIDETELKDAWLRHTACAPLEDLAVYLAEAKASDVSARHRDALAIGSDQVLALGETMISKAADREGARNTLLALRGRTHQLHSAAAIAVDGAIVWRGADTALLTVRMFSDAWLSRYLDEAGDALLRSVGCYEFEGLGVQLFDRIDGDYFTILGMPLLPLLAELRRQEIMPS